MSDKNFNQLLMEMASLGAGENDSALKVIDASHQRTHEGEMFAVGYRWATVASAGVVNFSLAVPAGIVLHTIWSATATGKTYFDFYSGATGVSGGTAITPMNKNTSSTKTTTATVKRDVTVADYGALTLQPISSLFGSGQAGNSVGGSNGMNAEFMLNAATTWIWKYTNNSGGNEDITLTLQFYDTQAA